MSDQPTNEPFIKDGDDLFVEIENAQSGRSYSWSQAEAKWVDVGSQDS